MQVFRVSPRDVASAKKALGDLVHLVDGREVVSSKSAAYLAERVKGVAKPTPLDLDQDRWFATSRRLHSAWAAMVSEPLPDDVATEARLLLYADPELELEFMGRGRVGHQRALPAAEQHLLSLDRAGGRRYYMFRRLVAPKDGKDERLTRVTSRYLAWHKWLNDPEARVVLSLGGGGFRLFAAIPVLKAIEQISGDRNRIAEVWGSSGGAFLGYAYAAGFPLDALDQFAFDLYNGRVPHLQNGSITSIVRSRVRAAVSSLRGDEPPPEMVDWLVELEKRHPPATRLGPRPFYAIASSTERVGLTALTSKDHIVPGCEEFMVECEPHLAVAASTAVPFVLRPVKGIGDRPNEVWFDGSISDENPLALPYVKWLRERARGGDVPKKLKIVLVNLNLRASESSALRAVGKLPVLRKLGVVDEGSRVVDMLLDSKTTTNIRIVTATPGVEILSAKLNLGWLNAQGPREIAKAVRSGRSLESWHITIHGSGTS
jgi:predicted acylesterase/phospholipase RssA